MPRIPTYEGPQVRSEALRPVYQRAPDLMSGARQTAQALAAGAEMLDRRIERDAQDEAFRLELQVRTDYQRQRAALREQFRGDQADQYRAAMADWWKKAPETYGQNASPMAKQIANRALGQLMLQAESDTLGYVEGEKRRSREINFRTLQNQTIIDAGRLVNPANADALAATTAAQIRDRAIAYAAGEGYGAEVGVAMANEQLAKYHADVAVALASRPGGAQAAKDYLLKYGSAIPLDVRTRIDTAVQGEADNQEATRVAASLAPRPFQEQLAEVAKIENPAVREKALQRVRENQALVMAAQQERERVASDQAWQLVGQGRAVPEALLVQMDGKERVTLQDHVREKAKQAAAGEPVKTDWAVYIDARERLARGEKVNLTALTTKIAPAQMEQLIDVATQAGKGGATQDAMLTDAQRVDAALVGLGIDKKKDPETAGRFSSEVDRRVRALSAERQNKPVTADEKQRIIDEVALDKVYVSEFGRDPRKPLALLTPDELAKAYVNVGGREVLLSSIPAADRTAIIRALRQTGQPITEQNIAEMYVEGQRRKVVPAPTEPGVRTETRVNERGNTISVGVGAVPDSRGGGMPVLTLGTPVAPPPGQPSPYASPAEWAAYRASQAAAVAPAPAAPAPAPAPAPAASAPAAPAPAAPAAPAPAAPAPAAPAPARAAPTPAPAPAAPAPAAPPAAPAPAPAAAPAPARSPAPAPARAPAPVSQELIRSAREIATSAEAAVVRLNNQMQQLRADIAKSTDDDRRKRLEGMLKELQTLAVRAQEQRSRALRDLERYGAQR